MRKIKEKQLVVLALSLGMFFANNSQAQTKKISLTKVPEKPRNEYKPAPEKKTDNNGRPPVYNPPTRTFEPLNNRPATKPIVPTKGRPM